MSSFKITETNYDLYSIRYSDLKEFTKKLIFKLNDSYFKYFPLKIKFVRNREYNKPWITRDVVRLH